MAVWQFDFRLISRKKLFALFGEIPAALDEKMEESLESWGEALLPEDYVHAISSIMPEDRSWSPQIRMWGEEDGDRIALCFDPNQGNSFLVRVDLRTPNQRFISDVIELATYLDALLLLTEDTGIMEPSIDTLTSRMGHSNASSFVKDPTAFFKSVKERKLKFTAFEDAFNGR